MFMGDSVKKKYVVLNLILVVYILTMSIGYAFFNKSLTVKGVASTVDFYSGDNLPTTAVLRDASNNLYYTALNVPSGITYSDENWQDDTYTLTYNKDENLVVDDVESTSFTVSFINPSALSYTEGLTSSSVTEVESSSINATSSFFDVNPSPIGYINQEGLQKLADTTTNIASSATLSKTTVEPGETVDVTFTVATKDLSSSSNEVAKSTISYMLQGKRRYFYFIINFIAAKKYYTFTVNPTPSNATVTINGENTKSVTVKEGTTVNWSVSLTNYATQSGSETITSDITKNITLTETTHNYSSWTVEKAATCTETGVEARTCSQCGLKETRDIAALGHSYAVSEVQPSYSGRGYYLYTCSRCGHQYTENTSKELYLINDKKLVDQSAWSTAFNNTSSSTLNPSSSFGGAVSYGIATLAVSYTGNYGVMYTGPINLTDAKSVVFSYVMWDNLYKTRTVNDPNDTSFSCKYLNKCNTITQTQKGINTSYFGVTTNTGNNTSFTKSSSVKFTRTGSSDSVKTGTITIDVSSLTGNYYVKVYTKHSYSGTAITTANTAYTGFNSIKIVYN